MSKLVRSNAEYLGKLPSDEHLRVFTKQFKNRQEYESYVQDVIEISRRAKDEQGELDEY